MATKIKLNNVRLFFNDLFTAVEFKAGDGRPRFSATLGILKTDKKQLAAIEAAMQAEATEGWKTKGAAMLKSFKTDAGKCCISDGDAKTWEGAEGCMLLGAHRQEKAGRPYVVDQKKNPVTEADGKIYSGCYVNASVEIWAQSGQNQGMRCGLLGIQKCGEGDSFSGAGTASPDDFDEIDEGANAEDIA